MRLCVLSRWLGVVIVLLVFHVLPWNANAANHYVRADAAGTASGADWTDAYVELPASLVRGDTYYIADGLYDGYLFDDAESGTVVITVIKATVSDHGTATGWLDSYGDGQAVFDGGTSFWSAYWVLDGVTGGGPANGWNGNFGFKIDVNTVPGTNIRIGQFGNPHDITIRHIDIEGFGSVATNPGIWVEYDVDGSNATANLTFSYLWFHGIGSVPLLIDGGHAGTGITGDIIVEYAYVQSYFGSGAIHTEVMSAAQGELPNVTWRNSLITDIQLTGGLMWWPWDPSNPTLNIYGNVFYKASGAAWQATNGIIGGWTAGTTKNINVYNNTFIGISEEIFVPFAGSPSNNIAKNNLFYNCSNVHFYIIGTHDYNHFINSGTVQGEPNCTTSIADPFVDYVGLDFGLIAASGPVDKGIPLGAPYNTDPLYVSRTEGATYDAGAYELFQGGPSNPPAPLPQPPPAGGGYFQANERPSSGARVTGSRPAAGTRTPR